MATRESYIPFQSPFRGVSSSPARLSQGGFSPLAINCDTSQGVLRGRPGYRVINQQPNERVLGCHSVIDYDGSAQILAVYYQAGESTRWGSVIFRVIASTGASIGPASTTISSFPYDITPGPFEFPRFVDFGSATYILFPKGAMYMYDSGEKEMVLVRTSKIASNAIFPYFESIPSGSIAESHGRRLFMAGFRGDKSFSVTTNSPVAL